MKALTQRQIQVLEFIEKVMEADVNDVCDVYDVASTSCLRHVVRHSERHNERRASVGAYTTHPVHSPVVGCAVA